MKRVLAGLLGLLLTAAMATAQAGPLAYAVATDQNLYSVDVATGTATLIGSTGVQLIEGLARDPTTGQLYGTDSNGNLYAISSTTGAATLIGTPSPFGGSTGRDDIEGLDFDGSTLLGSTFGGGAPTIFSIDLTTAATTDIVTANVSTDAVRSMAVLNPTTVLIRADFGPGPNSLYSIDLVTGNTILIGALGGDLFAAIDFLSDGNLYGLDDNGDSYRINPATAGTTLLANTGGQFWLDMTDQPSSSVPEPSGLALFAIAALAIVAVRRMSSRSQVLAA